MMIFFNLNQYFQMISISLIVIFVENMYNLCYVLMNELLGEEIRLKAFSISRYNKPYYS